MDFESFFVLIGLGYVGCSSLTLQPNIPYLLIWLTIAWLSRMISVRRHAVYLPRVADRRKG
jgi:hypothetical protein